MLLVAVYVLGIAALAALAWVAAIVRHGPYIASIRRELAHELEAFGRHEEAVELRRSAARLERWRVRGISKEREGGSDG